MSKAHGKLVPDQMEKPKSSAPTKSHIHKSEGSSKGQPRPNLPGPGMSHEKEMC